MEFGTEEQVRKCYPDIPPSKDVSMSLETARAMVQSNIVDSGCGAGYSDEKLDLITNWLASHLWQVQNGIISGKSAGAASVSYVMSTDYFLKGTLQGQTAMMLDTNHCLAQLMAETELAIQGKQSFPPQVVSLHSTKQTGMRRRGC